MTTKSKALAAGVAIMVTGAVIGWGASRMVDAKSGSTASDPTVSTLLEQPSGNLTPQTTYRPERPAVRRTARVASASGIRLPAGTPISVTLHGALSTKTASVGDSWSGTVAEPVYRNGREVIPAGSHAQGVVAVAQPAERGDRATLQLALRSITVDGRRYTVRGSSAAVVAGSPRKRNVGAIAGGTAAGALIGRAVGHSTKSTVIGALVGGGAATAAVAASKGYQATIAAGQEMHFTTVSSVTVRT